MRAAGAVAVALTVASLGGVLAVGASAAQAPAGRSGVVSLSGRYGSRALVGCDFYQVDTPPPVGDHRYAINNTCDGGMKHWVVLGKDIRFEGQFFISPGGSSDPYCARYVGSKVPSVGGTCVNVDHDLMPAINDWGNYFR